MTDLLHLFPPVNASLNATSGVCLVIGFLFILKGNITWHRRFMLAACVASVVFLASYITHHYLRQGVVTRFTGTGWVRPLYFSILTSHTILAVVIVPLAIMSVWNGLKMRLPQHRRVVRWTLPLWLYVSVTGVLVYFFLYRWYPSS